MLVWRFRSLWRKTLEQLHKLMKQLGVAPQLVEQLRNAKLMRRFSTLPCSDTNSGDDDGGDASNPFAQAAPMAAAESS